MDGDDGPQDQAQDEAPRQRRRDDRDPRGHARALRGRIPLRRHEGSAFIRAAFAAAIFAVVMLAVLKGRPAGVLITTILLLGVYTPFGFYFDRWMYRRRLAQVATAGGPKTKR